MFSLVKKTVPWLMVFLLFLAGYLVAHHFQVSDNIDNLQRLDVPRNCQFNAEPCQIKFKGYDINITVQNEVSVLKPFFIELEGDGLESAIVNFEMLGMDMGINRFQFHDAESSGLETTAMLPVCSASRNDWIADFTIRLSSNESFILRYPFTID